MGRRPAWKFGVAEDALSGQEDPMVLMSSMMKCLAMTVAGPDGAGAGAMPLGVGAEGGELVLPEWLPGAVMALGVVLVTTVVLRQWFRKRGRSRRRDTTDVRERVDERVKGYGQQRMGEEIANRLMVEMQETARLCATQVANRAAKLEALLAQADARIAELEGRLARMHAGAGEDDVESFVGDPLEVSYGGYAEEIDSLHGDGGEGGVARVAVERVRPAERAVDGGVGEVLGVAAAGGTGGMDPLSARVCALSRQGLTAMEIAQRLEEHVGKVELILALRGSPTV